MIFLIIGFVLVMSFFVLSIGGFYIFFCEDISDWLQAKTDEIRARTELFKKEREDV